MIASDHLRSPPVATDHRWWPRPLVLQMRRTQYTKAGGVGVGPLKLVIMSATLQVDTFRENRRLFPSPPPVLKVEARQYPVTTHFSRVTPDDHLDAAYRKVLKIHGKLPAGGILVFLTGQAEIEHLLGRLQARFDRFATKRAAAAAAAAKEAAGASEAHRAAEAGLAAVARLEAADGEAACEGWLIGEEAEAAEEEPVGDVAPRPRKVSVEEAMGATRAAVAAAAAAGTEEGEEEGEEEDAKEGEESEEEGEEDDESDSDDEGAGGPVLLLPLYSMLPAAEQMRVWSPPADGTRLIVIATNVAETSITIPNISYVVDCGKHKQRTFTRSSAVSQFELEWVSQASADQRAGRAGRSGPGHCYRLYSSSVYTNIFEPFATPEIRRAPVEGLVLQMKAMGIARVATFPFPEPPPLAAIHEAETALGALGAIASGGGSTVATATLVTALDWPVTSLGRLLARLPISPRLGKLLLVCRKEGHLRHGLVLVAMLAQQEPYAFGSAAGGGEGGGEGAEERTAMTAAQAAAYDARLAAKPPRWQCAHSDALCLVGAYVQWLQAGGNEAAARLCGLVAKVMREAQQLAAQLGQLLATLFPDDAAAAEEAVATANPQEAAAAAAVPVAGWAPLGAPDEAEAISLRRALTSASPDRLVRLAPLCDAPPEKALLMTAAKTLTAPKMRRAYLAANQGAGHLLWLPPRSPLAQLKPRPAYVVFTEIRADDKRPLLLSATAVEPGWLVEAAGSLTGLGEPLLSMAPRYEAATDRTLCWRAPSYRGAAVTWSLPAVPRPPPPAPPWLAAALFGRALCAGAVLKPLRALAEVLEPRARLLTDASSTDRSVLGLRAALASAGLTSQAALAAAWAREPRLLLRPLAAMLDEPRRPHLVELWPRLLVVAERGDARRRAVA